MGGRSWLDFSIFRDRHWLGFCSAAKNYLFLGSGSAINSVFLAFCVRASSRLGIRVVSWFQWWGRNYFGVCVGDRNRLGSGVGIETDLIFVRGVEIDFFLCVWVDNRLFFMCELKLVWFLCARQKLPFLLCWSIDSFFVWVVEIELVSVCGPKITCFQCEHRTWLRFCVGGLSWLHFSVEIEIDSVFV